ncbi:MAG: site-2 protease family protein [Candidatus Saccharimonadales bacterium]
MFESLTVTQIVIFVASILISMSLHEAMHSFAAYWLGDTTAKDEGRLSVNPIKHIDPITTVALPTVMVLLHLPPILAAKPVPFDPRSVRWGEYGAALVALAGPFTNLLLAILGAGFLRLFGADLDTSVVSGALIFISVNIGFFVFNMIPVPPLDGSRLLYAFAPEPLQRIMYTIESFGFFAILAFFFLLYPFISGTVGDIYTSILQFLLG